MRNVVHRFPNLGTGSPFGERANQPKEMGRGGSVEMGPSSPRLLQLIIVKRWE